jgi:hypothetical protein
MASSATTKAARRGARDATIAAQGEIARRTRANMDDLTVFFSARQRVDAVDDWLAERVEALRVQADARRADQRRQCGGAGPAECVLRQADRYRPGGSAYTSRTALLTKRRAVRSTNHLVTRRA